MLVVDCWGWCVLSCCGFCLCLVFVIWCFVSFGSGCGGCVVGVCVVALGVWLVCFGFVLLWLVCLRFLLVV